MGDKGGFKSQKINLCMWVVIIKKSIFKVFYYFLKKIILLAEKSLKLVLIVAVLPDSGVSQQ